MNSSWRRPWQWIGIRGADLLRGCHRSLRQDYFRAAMSALDVHLVWDSTDSVGVVVWDVLRSHSQQQMRDIDDLAVRFRSDEPCKFRDISLRTEREGVQYLSR